VTSVTKSLTEVKDVHFTREEVYAILFKEAAELVREEEPSKDVNSADIVKDEYGGYIVAVLVKERNEVIKK